MDSDQDLTQASINSGNTAIRHYFGMTMTTRFVQRYDGMTTKGGSKPMTFQFSGDAAVWIFIHGIAAMLVTGYLDLEEPVISSMLTDVYLGLLNRSKENTP